MSRHGPSRIFSARIIERQAFFEPHGSESGTKKRMRILAEGLQFPEGPVALADGSVLLVEMRAGPVEVKRPDT